MNVNTETYKVQNTGNLQGHEGQFRIIKSLARSRIRFFGQMKLKIN